MAQKDNSNQAFGKVAATSLTLTGRAPSTLEWLFPVADVKKDIASVLNTVIPEIRPEDDIDLFFSGENRVSGVVKISKENRNLQDKSNKDIILQKPLYKASPELKEIMEKYCPSNNRKLIKDEDNRFLDLELDLERVYNVLMDTSGEYAKDITGAENAIKTRITITAVVSKDDPKRIRFIEIKKAPKGVRSKGPRPTKSFNR